MLSVYDLVDFLTCLCGCYNIGWIVCVCCWSVVGAFWCFDVFGFCGLGLVWVLILVGLPVFWLAGGGGLLVYFVVWVLDFGVDVWGLYIAVYCCAPGLCLGVAICLLGVCGLV